MPILDHQVGRTQRRLTANVIMQHVAWGVLIGALAWAFVVIIERAFVLGIPLHVAVGVAAIAAVVIAGLGTYRGRVDRLRAAIFLDEAAQLRERVSTALTCRQSADPFARAAVHDAERKADGVHVPTHVRYRPPDLWPWSLATVLVAAIFFWFMPELNLLAGEKAEDEGDALAAAQQEREAVEVALEQQIEAVKRRLQDKPAMAALQGEIEKLELPDEPTKTPEDVRREAVKKIESVADRLKKRLEADAANALQQLKRDLAKLETPKGDDFSSKLAQALASGDMQAAKKAMSDLKKALDEAAKSGDAEAQKKLAEMQKKLDELSKQLAKLGDQQKLLKDLENKAGLSEEEAKKLLEKLAGMDPEQIAEQLRKNLADSGMSPKQIEELARKIAQNQQMMQQLKSMAQAMSQVAQACQQCQGGGQAGAAALAQALDGAMGQMSELELAEQMMNELQAQLAELEDLKEGVCQGNCRGWRPGDPNSVGRPGPNPDGQGYGAVPKQRAAHQYRATKAKTRTQGGQIIGQMLIDGPQIKGEAGAEVTEAVSAAKRDAEDAIERDEVPRRYQRVVQSYFDRLAGLIGRKAEADAEGDDEKPESDDEASEDGRAAAEDD